MSSIVAVAGGTGNLGRAIIEAIIADGKYKVVILGRKPDAQKEKDIGAPIIPIDYNSIDGLTKVLDDNKIDTVISVISSFAPDVEQSQLNLIEAAERASATKRFVPNVWGVKYTDDLAKPKVEAVKALERTKLEHTSWYTGCFADYFVVPHVKSYMTPLSVVIDMANNTAAILGSGDVPVVFTHTADVAKFVAASLALSQWEPDTYVIGDKLTWHEFLPLAEAAKGVKFKVTYDSVETLKSGSITELPSHPYLYPFFPKEQLQGLLASMELLFECGLFDFKPQRTINQSFPNVKAKTIKELLTEAWEGK